MGRHHQFFICSDEKMGCNYREYLKKKEECRIHDDFMNLISDALSFVPSYNPATGREGYGFNLYGATVINNAGSRVALGVFKGWRKIFTVLPEHPSLTIGVLVSEDGSLSPNKVTFDRDELILSMTKVIDLLDDVNNGGKYILHLGI